MLSQSLGPRDSLVFNYLPFALKLLLNSKSSGAERFYYYNRMVAQLRSVLVVFGPVRQAFGQRIIVWRHIRHDAPHHAVCQPKPAFLPHFRL